MQHLKSNSTGWRVWLEWLLLNLLGWLASWGLSSFLSPGPSTSLPAIVSYTLMPVAMGVIVSALQWIILRRYFSGVWKWILYGAAGMWIGLLAVLPLEMLDLSMMQSRFQLYKVLYGTVFGFLMGLAQWLALRGQVPHSGWWIIASTLGWTVAMVMGEFLPLDWSSPYAGLVYTLATAGISAAVTGLFLVGLIGNFNHPAASLDSSPG